MGDKRAVCISASNMADGKSRGISYYICKMIYSTLEKKGISCEILNLRNYSLSPCTGCGGCRETGRCEGDRGFCQLYEKLREADYLFFVTPHCVPIPAKLCMLFEKMEQISFPEEDYERDAPEKLAGIISYGQGDKWEPENCKVMVNDTIRNVLGALRLKTVPYNLKWNTGISLIVRNMSGRKETLLVKEDDWKIMEEMVRRYVEVIVQTSRSLHAICQ